TYAGGLGFLYKWNMGWMHDTLEYMKRDPVHRRFHHGNLTFPLVYAYSEHYTLPLSHDEVVHGKGSLWSKMPGDPWQKAANLRLLYAHQVGHPGKKLLFMGSEYGQESEWSHDGELEWGQIEDPRHAGILHWTKDIYRLYREHPALWNDSPGGFEWIDFGDADNSTLSYMRRSGDDVLLFAFNFTPVPRANYRLGVPEDGFWQEILNSDSEMYGGSGLGNFGGVESHPVRYHGRPSSIVLTLPPLAVVVLARER
ncbi:MAG: alpha amylase C-terminal domain-containing protein, partial [Rhodothermales bacterium]